MQYRFVGRKVQCNPPRFCQIVLYSYLLNLLLVSVSKMNAVPILLRPSPFSAGV